MKTVKLQTNNTRNKSKDITLKKLRGDLTIEPKKWISRSVFLSGLLSMFQLPLSFNYILFIYCKTKRRMSQGAGHRVRRRPSSSRRAQISNIKNSEQSKKIFKQLIKLPRILQIIPAKVALSRFIYQDILI
ncbi:hypothetical protein J3Q64DRAFT_1698914 [Phycomyces blakesleeanus]|uniref:Uncharacterized protein n=2 Tax=Phycomyces blakesleeanus TaxID=4837 RepID=A0A162PII7_PHYB8|nr:hypothetical protein PHYBLDRAFT_65775 [Phycomyces blakesleeanus NRRL 1555(-)]OAD73177.1 hypothetical protein PHYBLDRAFT_65775 [Phycomyces blakesleeanus NRRL 1555(-)]|eukprot:XP_018291217.1 hypothetical protein PHYBLDRAFT_65775 [Phycomyces blakesleeanus NRRL 1555(-)]